MGSCTTLPKSRNYEESNMNKSNIETDKICTNIPTQQQFNSHNTKSPKPQKSVEKNQDKLIQCKLEKKEKENIELRKQLIEAKESYNQTILKLQRLIKKEQNDTQLNKQKLSSQQDSINAPVIIQKDEEEEGEEDETSITSVIITESIMQGLMMSPPNNWKYKDGILSIRVINAINVDNMDEDVGLDGASDLYVILELAGNYGTTQTKIIYNEENPVWNERFQLITDNPKTDIVKCTIWDKNKWTFDDKIGYVEINVIHIITENNGYIECKGFDVCDSQIGYKLYLDIKYWEVAK